ncbi:MAG: methyltransferase domain-containing protein [Deltaproteobacteria bacterium]|nr:methyltransferase domain-containing protein [Deltaproteobacteria bacterium]
MAPNPLLVNYTALLQEKDLAGPILDLACGEGQNGLYLAGMGLPVILADRSSEALDKAKEAVEGKDLDVTFREIDLETGLNPLEEDHYRAILVFRYLHRPLIPCLKKGLKRGGILIYETYTDEQPRFGRPLNPDHLLKPKELFDWFRDWPIIHYFEGILEDPKRAMAQIVCRKPFKENQDCVR